mmetsp:Transcript_48741/g.109427  ORF Transcript_48741/g.109427 Transcript_48741/m.109427 type:complete len:81 (+) Transcript_48741:183-425(+)
MASWGTPGVRGVCVPTGANRGEMPSGEMQPATCELLDGVGTETVAAAGAACSGAARTAGGGTMRGTAQGSCMARGSSMRG